jgi:hypothetical protein
MAMKKTFLLWVYLFISAPGQAQSINGVDSLNNINAIKRDTSYIYAEATMKDAIEAQSCAKAILEMKINDWLRDEHPKLNSDSLASNSRDKWFEIVTRRGKYKRAFVYVDKRILFSVAEEPKPEDPVSMKEDSLRLELTDDEKIMVGINRFSNIEPYIKGLTEEQRIKAYGKYASHPEEGSCYLFVYNSDGDVVAVLRQAEDGSHFNLREKKDDNVRNYKKCGAFWFQLKERQNN